jgi:hypothetical protein
MKKEGTKVENNSSKRNAKQMARKEEKREGANCADEDA